MCYVGDEKEKNSEVIGVQDWTDWSSRYCEGSNFGIKKLYKKQQKEIDKCYTYNRKRRYQRTKREGPTENKKRKKNERKTKWTQNYMDSPSGKPRVMQVKIGGDG